MDPFSIIVGTVGLADASLRLLTYLSNIKKGSVKIQDEITILSHEVQSLREVNESVEDLWESRHHLTSFNPALNNENSLDKASGTRIEDNWRKLDSLLHQSQRTIETLETLLKEVIGKKGAISGGKLDDLRKTIRKHDRDGDYMQIRARLANNQQGIQMFLNMLNLSYMLRHHASEDIAVGKISSDLQHQKVKLESKINSLRSALRGSVDSSDFNEFLDSADAVASLIRLNKHFCMPQNVSSYYTGRQKQLEELKTTLGVLKSRERQDHQRRFVIHGLGGSGKTQFCCKFGQDNREQFWGIFWIDGSSYENAKHSYADIGRLGGVEPNENAAKSWLSSLQQPWLLLIDNADDPEVDVTRFFPGGERGVILITTRDPTNRRHGTEGTGFYHFENLEVEEASDLLLAAAVFPRPWETATRECARKAAHILGYLPLAIIHAGKAILERLCSLSEYPEYYQRTWDRIRRSRSRSPWRGKAKVHKSDMSVYSSYEMIYLGLESKGDCESKDALELLKMFSFFHWENIEFQFLKNAALNPRREQENLRAKERATKAAPVSKVPKTWKTLCQEWAISIADQLTKPCIVLPAVLRDGDDQPFYGDRLREALSLLERLGMLTSHAENDSYWMHPLVHDWVRQRPETSTAEQALWCQAASTVLAQSIFLRPPEAYAAQNEHLQRQIYPHVENVRKLQTELEVCIKENVETLGWPWSLTWLTPRPSFGRLQAQEAVKFSLVYLQCGYWATAEELQLQVKEFIYSRVGLGPDSEYGIGIAFLLSKVYALQTRNNEARELQYQVLESAKRFFGPEHPTTLNIMDTLAATCNLGTRLHEAQQLHQQVIDTLSKLDGIGPNHESTYTAMDNLAKVKLRYFDIQGAITLQSQAYEGFRDLLGSTNQKTLEAQINLADISGHMGEDQLAPSLEMGEEVVYHHTQELGREHPLTLKAKLTVAKIKIAMDQFDEAEEMFQECLPIAERNLGENHLGTLTGHTWRGHLFWRQGLYSEAEAIFENVIRKHRWEQSKRGDGEHSDRVQAMWFLVFCYEDQNKIQEALSLCEDLIRLIRDFGGEGLGKKHKLYQHLMEKRNELLKIEKTEVGRGSGDVNSEAGKTSTGLSATSSPAIPPKRKVKDFTF